MSRSRSEPGRVAMLAIAGAVAMAAFAACTREHSHQHSAQDPLA